MLLVSKYILQEFWSTNDNCSLSCSFIFFSYNLIWESEFPFRPLKWAEVIQPTKEEPRTRLIHKCDTCYNNNKKIIIYNKIASILTAVHGRFFRHCARLVFGLAWPISGPASDSLEPRAWKYRKKGFFIKLFNWY